MAPPFQPTKIPTVIGHSLATGSLFSRKRMPATTAPLHSVKI
jgi:hypothetical protein